MSKSMKVLVLAGILSIAAASVVQAGGHGTSGDFHAKAAPVCDTHRCPVLAGDGGPGGPTDGTSRSGARMAGDGAPTNPGDNNGRSGARMATDGPPPGSGSGNGRSSAALSKGRAEFRVAGGRVITGDV
jgi:hypothetical protein